MHDPRPLVHIVRTGSAHLAAVIAGLSRVGAKPCVTDDPRAVLHCDRLVLPGVGKFGAAMQFLEENDLVPVLEQRVLQDRPTLAICLGMQLLGQSSEESPGIEGIGAFAAAALSFPPDTRVPQLGWNHLQAPSHSRFLRSGYAYFAHSCRILEAPPGWNAAFANYAGQFVAALERGRVLACQFHPELSGDWGMRLLRCWVDGANALERSAC